jgi:hypothetical protein
MPKLTTAILSICILFASISATAQPSSDIWSVNGYGTLGVAHSSERNADYIPNPIHSDGPGLTRRWDPRLDSRAALQVSAQPTSRVSAVVQVIAEQHFDGSFKPLVEWANIQYDVSPSFAVRVGRTAMGTFMVSDHRKVGYALPWIRPPADLYHLLPLTNSDGVDFLYRHDSGHFRYTSGFHYGRTKAKELDGLLEAPNLWSFNNRLERGALTLHASYMSAKIELGEFFQSLWGAYSSFGPPGEAVVERYDFSGNRATFGAIGMKYDPGNWFLMAEWGRGDLASDFGSRSGHYLSGGYRLETVTPFVTYASARSRHKTATGLDASFYPTFLTPAINTLNQGLASVQAAFGAQQYTWSIGARWDILPRISAKVQYDHVTTRGESSGLFRNQLPGYRSHGGDIVSASMDFVF